MKSPAASLERRALRVSSFIERKRFKFSGKSPDRSSAVGSFRFGGGSMSDLKFLAGSAELSDDLHL